MADHKTDEQQSDDPACFGFSLNTTGGVKIEVLRIPNANRKTIKLDWDLIQAVATNVQTRDPRLAVSVEEGILLALWLTKNSLTQ